MKHEKTNPKLRSFLFFLTNILVVTNIFVNSPAIATYSHLFLSFRYLKIYLSDSHYLLNKIGGGFHKSIPSAQVAEQLQSRSVLHV